MSSIGKGQRQRIGIYSGTFNPVHAGHIAFALQALQTAKLDAVYFLPERRPRHKQAVEHFAHRVAMLNSAVRPHPKLHVLETDDISFTVRRTLPNLQQRFAGAQLVMLLGSDVVPHVPLWPHAKHLLQQSELVVGLREDSLSEAAIVALMSSWHTVPRSFFVASHAPDVSSHKVREALRARTYAKGLLRSVVRYSDRHWLYVSLKNAVLDKA